MIGFLLHAAGAVALLIWGAYMVKTGILRAFGEPLRAWLGSRLKNRAAGFAAGFGLAMLLQSSTASALLVASLQASGLVTTAIALSAVLGADFGSAVVARILTLDLSWLVPVLLISGTFLFMRRMESRAGQFGSLLLGLAVVLLALQSIMATAAPMKESPELLALFAEMADLPLLAAFAGMCCALLFFSSLAVVALASAAAASGALPLAAALWIVLGANFGSALLAALTTAGASSAARKAPLGNFFFRVCGFAAGAAALWLCPQAFEPFIQSSDGIIFFHVVYNAAVGAAGLLFIVPAARLIDRLIPAEVKTDDFEVKLLSQENMLSGAQALGFVRKETVKTAKLFRKHWMESGKMISDNLTPGEILELKSRRKLLARRCRTVGNALNIIVRENLTAKQVLEWQTLSAANDALRFAVDVSGTIAASIRKKKTRRGLFFSPQGVSELEAEHEIVARHAELFAEILEGSSHSAEIRDRILYEEEHSAGDTPELVARHMARVDKGSALSIETSALHLDLLILFRRVDSIIATGARGF